MGRQPEHVGDGAVAQLHRNPERARLLKAAVIADDPLGIAAAEHFYFALQVGAQRFAVRAGLDRHGFYRRAPTHVLGGIDGAVRAAADLLEEEDVGRHVERRVSGGGGGRRHLWRLCCSSGGGACAQRASLRPPFLPRSAPLAPRGGPVHLRQRHSSERREGGGSVETVDSLAASFLSAALVRHCSSFETTTAMADEVETDDEIRPKIWDGAADYVDTDEDLKRASASTKEDKEAHCLWGKYESAKIKAVQQGMYHVKFDDGASRWATCGELVLSELARPLWWLQPALPSCGQRWTTRRSTFATPVSQKPSARTPRAITKRQLVRHYMLQGTLTKRVSPAEGDQEEQWEVRLDDIDQTTSTHPASELKLPVAHGGLLGVGGRLKTGARVMALRGEWRKATLHGGAGGSGSRSRGRHVLLDLGNSKTVETWVSGGQLIMDEPANPAALTPGTRCVAHVPTRQLRPHVECAIISIDGSEAQCVDDGAKAFSVPIASLRNRLDVSFRVICSAGGFQRATISGCTPDGLYRCHLSGGAERWVSAAELTTAQHTAAECYGSKASHPLAPGTFVALVPDGGIRPKTRWLTSSLVVAPANGKSDEKGKVTLRRPQNQKPLTLRIERREGRFGIGLDEQNRVVELKPGCSAIDAGIEIGDKLCRVDGVAIHSSEDLAKECQGKGAD